MGRGELFPFGARVVGLRALRKKGANCGKGKIFLNKIYFILSCALTKVKKYIIINRKGKLEKFGFL